jgi:AraC-like DNA-binding protein
MAAVRTPATRMHIEVALRNVVRVDFSRDPRVDLTAATRQRPRAVLVEMLPGGGRSVEAMIRALRRELQFTPIIAYCARWPEGGLSQSVLAAARAGAEYLILKEYDDVRRVVIRVLNETRFARVAGEVLPLLDRWLPVDAQTVIAHCIEQSAATMTVPHLAGIVGVHRRTLTRRLNGLGLPSPESVIGWSRLIVAAYFLEHVDAPVDRLALHLGFVSGSALRGMLKRYTALTPADVARPGGLLRVVRRFAAVCRAGAARSAETTDVGSHNSCLAE